MNVIGVPGRMIHHNLNTIRSDLIITANTLLWDLLLLKMLVFAILPTGTST